MTPMEAADKHTHTHTLHKHPQRSNIRQRVREVKDEGSGRIRERRKERHHQVREVRGRSPAADEIFICAE